MRCLACVADSQGDKRCGTTCSYGSDLTGIGWMGGLGPRSLNNRDCGEANRYVRSRCMGSQPHVPLSGSAMPLRWIWGLDWVDAWVLHGACAWMGTTSTQRRWGLSVKGRNKHVTSQSAPESQGGRHRDGARLDAVACADDEHKLNVFVSLLFAIESCIDRHTCIRLDRFESKMLQLKSSSSDSGMGDCGSDCVGSGLGSSFDQKDNQPTCCVQSEVGEVRKSID